MATTNIPRYTDRNHPRHPTPLEGDQAIRASLELEAMEIHGLLADISRFGACVKVPQELTLMALPRTVLTLRATLGTETVAITADLRWIHCQEGSTTIGMGFPYGPLESGSFLDSFLNQEPPVEGERELLDFAV